MEDCNVEWTVRAIRGATTVESNTVQGIRVAVMELLDALEDRNQLDPEKIISATFSVTRDLDAIFPAAIARQRPKWDNVALLDVQHMYVENDLQGCIRFLIHVNLPVSHQEIYHPYLRGAKNLRPDWSLASSENPSVPAHSAK